jgi:hypothetical protein
VIQSIVAFRVRCSSPMPVGKSGRSIAKITSRTAHEFMGNRHHHKKQRTRVRALMAETGESYQRVLSRLRADEASKAREGLDIDLLRVDYFGTRVAVATFQILESLSCVVLPSSRFPLVSSPTPKSPLFGLARLRTVH